MSYNDDNFWLDFFGLVADYSATGSIDTNPDNHTKADLINRIRILEGDVIALEKKLARLESLINVSTDVTN